MEPELTARLRAAGAEHIEDPHEAWMILFEYEGNRATLVDRYALEASVRSVDPGELPDDVRRRLADEVLSVRYPGIELLGAGGGDSIEVVPYDEVWVDGFRAWRDRLREVLAGLPVRVEHVGSTAVPGLAAKPIIDVQVSVPDVEDEDRYVAAIESLGLPLRAREPGHRYFRPPPGAARTVQVHVCSAGSSWERDHLLFRDYLRAHADARDAYAALKVELAERYVEDRLAYNEAKTGFILDILETR
jgi:GrpB-like predicted nucleotidyltransferase (UPF0157 family)